MQKYTKNFIYQLAKNLDINLPEIWSGIKAVFIIKFDGERDKNPYTLLITKKELFIRIDTDDLDYGICYVIGEYAASFWNI